MSISRVNELALALLAVFWGCVLLLPGDLFAGIERYRLIGRFFPDTVWGILMVLSAAILFKPDSLPLRKAAHWLLCTIWSGMTILSLMSMISAPALLIASLLATISFFHATKFWRLGHLPVVNP